MFIVRKQKEIFIENENFKKLIEDKYFQQRDLLVFDCLECNKKSSIKFNNEKYWENGLLCSSCKTKKTNLKKYGVENVSNSPAIKNKIKNSIFEKYGDWFVKTNEYKKAKKETCLKKYGVEDFSLLETVKEKRKQTSLNKYGVSHPMKFKEISKRAGLSIRKKRFNGLKSFKLNKITPLFNYSEYNGNKIKNKYNWKCSFCGKTFKDHIYSGRIPKCPFCFGSKSNLEKELSDFISEFVERIETNKRFFTDKDLRRNYELDIFLPDFNLGIEFNGLYWHDDNKVGKDYHLKKYIFFKNIGINIINIFEDEWLEKKEIIKSIVLSKLNIREKKFFARKCIIRKLTKEEEINFFNKNHIQGYIISKVCFGAFFNNELVSAMSFGKSRFNKRYDWELLRFANLLNTNNIGIGSRFLKIFREEFSPKNIISYCDLRFFTGSIYEKMGFNYTGQSAPNYYYTKRHRRYSRIQFQKHKLKEKLKVFNEEKTEKENVIANGFGIIYDIGNKVFLI